MIVKPLSQNSCNKREFVIAAPNYESLQKSGYKIKLQYEAPKKPKSRNRGRNAIWFNPIQRNQQNEHSQRIFLSVK